MDRLTLAEMERHSMFHTVEQLHQTIDAHLKHIQIRLAPSAMKVLDVLRMHSKMAIGVSYLLIDTIVSHTKFSRSSVERAIRLLEKVGIIKRIPRIRPEKGGDGANMYAFQPLDEGAQMKGRRVADKPTLPSDPTPKFDGNTSVSLNKKESIKTYVQEPRQQKDSFQIPLYIPKQFVKAVKVGFANAKMVIEMWKRVIMFKRKAGITDRNTLLDIALQAWEYTIATFRNARKEWSPDRLFQCFYGTMREIAIAQNENAAAQEEMGEQYIPETDEELKDYLNQVIQDVKGSHGVESRFVLVNILAKEVQNLYPALSLEGAKGVVKRLGY